MVKHNQSIRRQQPTNGLSVFDHFVGLTLEGLRNLTIRILFFVNYAVGRVVFRTQPNIYDGAFKKAPSSLFDWVLNTSLVSHSELIEEVYRKLSHTRSQKVIRKSRKCQRSFVVNRKNDLAVYWGKLILSPEVLIQKAEVLQALWFVDWIFFAGTNDGLDRNHVCRFWDCQKLSPRRNKNQI